MDADRNIAAVAARQHGLVTFTQLRASGLSERAVHARASGGRLDRIHRGVYRVGGSAPSFEQELLAACLSLGGLVAASHRAAAALWGLELPDAPVCEVTRAAGRSPRLPGVVVHRGVDLVPDHVVRRRGIPVTNPLRLLVDLGAVVPGFVVENALDDLTGRRVVTFAGVRAFHESVAARGRSGVGVLREILDRRADADQMSRSRLESMLLRLADRAGLPTPPSARPDNTGRLIRSPRANPHQRWVHAEISGRASGKRERVRRGRRRRGRWG